MAKTNRISPIQSARVLRAVDQSWLEDHTLPAFEREPDDEVYYESLYQRRLTAANLMKATRREFYDSLPDALPPGGRQCFQPRALVREGDDFKYDGLWHRSSKDTEPYEIGLDRIPIPCNLCEVCRINQQRELVTRATHEVRLAAECSWFVTLTFSPETLPADGGLDHSIFAKFMKRVRRNIGECRMMMAGEYGESAHRAHYHVLLFGLHLPDVRARGRNSYFSPLLEKCWNLGMVHVGKAEHASIRYVAGYVVKKLTFARGADRVEERLVQLPSGRIERKRVKAEYGMASRNPGLGAKFADKFYAQVFDHGFIVLNEKPVKRIPAYYLRRWKNGQPPSEPGGERIPFPGYDLFLKNRTERAEGMNPPLSVPELEVARATLLYENRQRLLDRGKRKL